MAYENKIAMEPALEQGLEKIFGTESSIPETKEIPAATASTKITTNNEQITQATQAYDVAMQALRDGNWTKFGEEMQKVGEILKR